MVRALMLAAALAFAATTAAQSQEAPAPLDLPVQRPADAPPAVEAPPVIEAPPAVESPPILEAPQAPAMEPPLVTTDPPLDENAPVPLPVPRPSDAEIAMPPPPGVDLTAPPLSPPAAMVPGSTQPETMQRINDYLNSFRVMSGTFTQLGPDGSRTTGRFFISKPGRLRFQYDPPSPVELIADGRSVAIIDRKLNTQDLYLIGQTPLRFLLQDRLDLMTDSSVLGVTVEPDIISVTLEEASAIGGAAQIILMFSAVDYSLKQWTITDAQGYQTTVAIFDIDTTTMPDDKIFYIDELRSLQR